MTAEKNLNASISLVNKDPWLKVAYVNISSDLITYAIQQIKEANLNEANRPDHPPKTTMPDGSTPFSEESKPHLSPKNPNHTALPPGARDALRIDDAGS